MIQHFIVKTVAGKAKIQIIFQTSTQNLSNWVFWHEKVWSNPGHLE
jgi:hypothetical protein